MQTSKITIPMFPLNLVVLPGEELKLHIFEERYQQLLGDCETYHSTFGIPIMMEDTMLNLGTEVKLDKVEKRFENGESDIIVKGLKLFSIIGFYQELPEKLYGGGQIRYMDLSKYESSDIIQEEFFEYHSNYGSIEESETELKTDTLFEIGNALFLNPIQKLKLINNNTDDSREEVLRNQMRFLKIIKMQERKIENQFYPN